MPMVLSDVTTRRRDVMIKVEWAELQRMLSLAAIRDCGLDRGDGGDVAQVEVRIEQEEEGSPSYRVQKWNAMIKVALPVD